MNKLFLFFLIFSNLCLAKTKLFSKKSIFLNGYDPVSYLLSNKAQKGLGTITSKYDDVVIQFANKVHKDKFDKNPGLYIPAYGGWCAYALAKDKGLVKVDPESFKVIDGKTYLFYDSWLADTLKKWNKIGNDSKQIKEADRNWNKLNSL